LSRPIWKAKLERVIAYIDGFNLYFGLKNSGWRRYYWLDLQRLVRNLAKHHQEIEAVKYFTARISRPPDKQRRQTTYIEALGTLSGVTIFFGKYQLNPRLCFNCGYEDSVPNEKMTDVNIAVELLSDAFQNRFDTVLLISADSDLVPPLQRIRQLFADKRIVVAFPPQRSSKGLMKVAHAYFTIGREILTESLLPVEVKKKDGYVLRCPESWR
jgi:uncharacterized LabA/DUF88 family protein